jgi:putative FmdB family regulatory protein|uniref:Zinc ribbon domain-containing protein n=1 Tax=candidate division WOR-3 bacterium TaxID=2052148 RepID=A0A7C3Z0R5_UNCW3
MPVYEYRCRKCKKKFDLYATIEEYEKGLTPSCPKCGSKDVQRLFGRINIKTESKTEEFEDFEGFGE